MTKIYGQFFTVAKICLKKCVALKEIGDLPRCKMWMNLPLFIFRDLYEAKVYPDIVFLMLINTKLTLSQVLADSDAKSKSVPAD